MIAYGEQANLYAELGMYDQALEMNKKAQYYSMQKDSFGLETCTATVPRSFVT